MLWKLLEVMEEEQMEVNDVGTGDKKEDKMKKRTRNKKS